MEVHSPHGCAPPFVEAQEKLLESIRGGSDEERSLGRKGGSPHS
jgi:hypothetical protein